MLNIIAFYKQTTVLLLKIHNFSLFSILYEHFSFVVFLLATSPRFPALQKQRSTNDQECLCCKRGVKMIDVVIVP